MFIVVFDAIYCPCMFFVLKKTNLVYSQVSGDFARFPMFTARTLVENMLVCGVLSLSHCSTPQNMGAKQLNLGFFCPHVCAL